MLPSQGSGQAPKSYQKLYRSDIKASRGPRQDQSVTVRISPRRHSLRHQSFPAMYIDPPLDPESLGRWAPLNSQASTHQAPSASTQSIDLSFAPFDTTPSCPPQVPYRCQRRSSITPPLAVTAGQCANGHKRDTPSAGIISTNRTGMFQVALDS